MHRSLVILFLAVTAVSAQAPSTVSKPAIAWARIPAGSFHMGCVPDDPRCGVDEHPRHAVTFSKPFEMMISEVTVEMYRVAGLPLDEQPPWSTSPGHPVVIVTWDRAREFCGTAGGRLPTEAEWEYAARGGREGAIYPWGNQPPTDEAGATNGAAFENERPLPAKSFAPNAYGLYDVAGNVWEWTADAIGLYTADPVTDPAGPRTGRARIVRGGSFGDDPENLRVSNRTPNQPDRVNVNVGFRCARDVTP
jgi:formylglycine-generating enzyme required for sulfatase activity